MTGMISLRDYLKQGQPSSDVNVIVVVPNDGYDLSMKGDYLNRGNLRVIVIVVVHNK
jgi:hypothetical protein